MKTQDDRPMIASQSKICASEVGTPDDDGLNHHSRRVEPPVGFLNGCQLYNGVVPEI